MSDLRGLTCTLRSVTAVASKRVSSAAASASNCCCSSRLLLLNDFHAFAGAIDVATLAADARRGARGRRSSIHVRRGQRSSSQERTEHRSTDRERRLHPLLDELRAFALDALCRAPQLILDRRQLRSVLAFEIGYGSVALLASGERELRAEIAFAHARRRRCFERIANQHLAASGFEQVCRQRLAPRRIRLRAQRISPAAARKWRRARAPC